MTYLINMINNIRLSLPNFLIVGASKSGTSSLYNYLKEHPEIFMSSIKEPHFMIAGLIKNSKDPIALKRSRKNAIDNIHDYTALFNNVNKEKAVGEASTGYLFYYEYAIKNIKKYLKNPKIIIILRNPIERAFSAYRHCVRHKFESLSFEDALQDEDRVIENFFNPIMYYRDMGFYSQQVKSYMDNFSDVKICIFDDFRDKMSLILQDIFKFLDVNISFTPDLKKKYNVSEKKSFFLIKPDVEVRIRQYLKDVYSDDIIELEGITGKNLCEWL